MYSIESPGVPKAHWQDMVNIHYFDLAGFGLVGITFSKCKFHDLFVKKINCNHNLEALHDTQIQMNQNFV